MPPFCRVDGNRAGPHAVGILLPPGRRTTVIIRPRALDWDLLPVRPDGENAPNSPWWEMTRDEAARLAEQLHRTLEDWARGGPGLIQAEEAPESAGYRVRAELGRWTWLMCRRVPGQPYQAMLFATRDEASDGARRLTAILCPAENGEQELYFNTRNFSRA